MASKFVSDKEESQEILDQIKKQLGQKKLAKGDTMNLGKLVREKMKQMSTDLSGEYIDNSGKHFNLSIADDGYVVGYGGEAKRQVEITKPQAMKLTSACRKLGDDKKELSKKRLAKSTKEILAIANQVESARAGFFSRSSNGDMVINFRGDSPAAFENARRVANAIGSQASEPKADRMSGLVVITIKNAYKNLSIGEQVEKKLAARDILESGEYKGCKYEVYKSEDKIYWEAVNTQGTAGSKDEGVKKAKAAIDSFNG